MPQQDAFTAQDDPFDVDVGRNPGNHPVAAYSRCRKEPGRRDPRTGNALTQMPQWSTGRGCGPGRRRCESRQGLDRRPAV